MTKRLRIGFLAGVLLGVGLTAGVARAADDFGMPPPPSMPELEAAAASPHTPAERDAATSERGRSLSPRLGRRATGLVADADGADAPAAQVDPVISDRGLGGEDVAPSPASSAVSPLADRLAASEHAGSPPPAGAGEDVPAVAAGPGLPARVWRGFREGGPLMWVLLVTSIIGLTFALERLVTLRRSTHLPRGLAERVERCLRAGEFEKARTAARAGSGALASILQGLLARRYATRSERERILEDETGRVLWDLRRNVRPVGMVSSISPLLGLLGTVIGLILAFQEAATKGMDDPAHFAAGIYEALYTTAFGLTVAIPFLLLHHYLRGRADTLVRAAEARALRLVVELDEAEAWPVKAGETPSAPSTDSPVADAADEGASPTAEPDEVCAVLVEAA